jgi:hypothetical protein
MASRQTGANPIQAVPTPTGFRIERPGERYVVKRSGDELRGAWLGEDQAPGKADDTFTEREARLLLPLLRDMEHRAKGKGGRRAAEPTTPDGRLISRACKTLDLSVAALADRIGAHESVLSRARHGELPEAHRQAIRALLKDAA